MNIAVLIFSILTFVSSLYVIFFKSYFTEKGKNLATKQDIDGITKSVESIKVEFIKETERLKHELQFDNQINLGYHVDMKNSVIHLYETYSLWLTMLSESQDNSIGQSSKQLNEVVEELAGLYTKFLLAESKSDLYISDKTFQKQLYDLKLSTLKFHNAIELFLIDLSNLQEDVEEMEAEDEENDSLIHQEKIKKKNLIIRNKYHSFQESSKDDYKAISTSHITFANTCRALIKNIKTQ